MPAGADYLIEAVDGVNHFFQRCSTGSVSEYGQINFLIDMKIVNDTFNCGVRHITAETDGVCSCAIELKMFGDEILDVVYYGGCNGNLKGIAALAKGHKAADVQQRLTGITCGNKKTSCPDQLAQLLKAIM